MRTRRHRSAIALASGALLVLTGCGSEAASSNPSADQDSSSSAKSSSAKPAAATLSSSDLFDKTYAAAMKAGTAHLAMAVAGTAKTTGAGDLSYRDGKPAMQLTLHSAQMGGTIATRLVDGVFYLQIPGMTPEGKFLAVDPSDTSSPMGKAFGQLTSQADPLQSLKLLKGAIRSVEADGEDEIDGAQTTKYAVVVDTAKVLAKLAKGTTIPESAKAQMPETLRYDLWVGDDDLIRRLKASVAGQSVRLDLTKWGEPVTITKPAAADIVKQPSA